MVTTLNPTSAGQASESPSPASTRQSVTDGKTQTDSLTTSGGVHQQSQHWVQNNWRWLLGALMVLTFLVMLVFIFIVKFRKKPQPKLPVQVEADRFNEQVPSILLRDMQGPQPAGQQEAAGVPLMNGNSVDSGVNEESL